MKLEKKFQRASQARGITLVALVITIIIIIILATVTINMAFNGGIIDKAELASDMYANDTAYTDSSMANVVGYLDEMLNGVTGGGTDEPEEPENVETFSDIYTETKSYTDSEGKTAWIPKGFAVGTSNNINKINEGLVITTAIDENHYSTGNEFVWIPVDDESLAEMYSTEGVPKTLCGVTAKTNVYSRLRVRAGDNFREVTPGTNKGIREPDLVTDFDTDSSNYSVLAGSAQDMAEDMVEEYTATYESIAKYDGFYIGRYELTGTVESPTVQKGEDVLTADIVGNWYYLKKACTNLVQAGENFGAQSEMIYGNQWDEVMDWLIDTEDKTPEQINVDSSSWGNYSDYNTKNEYTSGEPEHVAEAGTKVFPAGSSEYWKANNIYDLAGNAMDWTQEALNAYNRIFRGGQYNLSGSDLPASSRSSSNSPDSSSYISSRPALYVALNADQT